VEAAPLGSRQRIGATARIEPGLPQRFCGIDISDACDAGLVEEKFLERPARFLEEIKECRLREFLGHGVDAELCRAWTRDDGFPEVDAAQMATVGEGENALVELERDVDVGAAGLLVCAIQELFGVGEPDEVAIEAKMHFDEATIKDEEEVLAAAGDGVDLAIVGGAGDLSWGLGLRGDGMEDMDCDDFAASDEWPQCHCDSFDFGELRHGC
jgi:hypothetical protein